MDTIDKIAMYENNWFSFLRKTSNLPDEYSTGDENNSTYRAYCNVKSETFNGELGIYLVIPGYYYGVWSNPESPELVGKTKYETAEDAYTTMMDIIKSKKLTIVSE